MSLNDHWVAMSETQPWKFFALQRLNFQSLKLNFQFLEGNFKMSEPCVMVFDIVLHLAPTAIDRLINPLIPRGLHIGHHKTKVLAFIRHFCLTDDSMRG